ncbi:HNH endonuclease [Ruminococcus sp. AF18-29]|nr:HNH endonuclease [Ruminococcus sp. AF18-29]
MVIPCYLISIIKLVRGLIMEEIIFENEIAYKTKYDGYYVTKSGKVITTKVKGGQGRINIFQPREHCYKVDKDGYLEVCLSFIENNRHIRKYYRVHRLVYETLMGDIPQELTIDHIDANPQNNSIENLQILTRENNTRKALKNKKSPKRFMYQLYKNNIYVGTFDRKELGKNIGLKGKDFYQDTNNKKQLLLQGYQWNLI